jgi:hypothetical protein
VTMLLYSLAAKLSTAIDADHLDRTMCKTF